MSKIEVNAIEPQCGTNLTLGANNDFIKLGTGAGFSGGIGTVRWETTAQTASFGATAGRGYFMNTTSGALTLTLPASPSAGDIVAIKDYAGTFSTNNLTIARNGSPMNGDSADSIRSTDNESLTLVYVDATKGWLAVEEGTGFVGETFMEATGGTITTSGNCKIHTFTGPGTFCVSRVASVAANNKVAYVVVAGGGGGSGHYGGGGGAGGYREGRDNPVTPYTASPLAAACSGLTVTATSFPITVGAGGAGGAKTQNVKGSCGSSSVFSTITSQFGGAAGSGTSTIGNRADGNPGGSGGGAGTLSPNCNSGSVGSGNTPPVSPPQGNNGGTGTRAAPTHTHGGGGGGAIEVGQNAGGSCQGGGDFGRGGNGATSSINATPTARAGGGGGSVNSTPNTPTGGSGGGGAGGSPGNTCASSVDGTANTGGGGGGVNGNNPMPDGGSGGSGIVIIRYKFQ